VNQIVVKPREVVSVYGKCHISLSNDEIQSMERSSVGDEVDEEKDDSEAVPTKTVEVVDSDEDEPEVVEEPVPAPKKKVVKKKAAAPVTDAADDDEEPVPKKKVVKKKAVAAS
jgi:hypothetical protein